MRYRIGFVFWVALLAFSCTDEVVTQRLADIQRLQQQVDSSAAEFATIDTALIVANKMRAGEQMDFLNKHYADTHDFEKARYIDVYYSNWKLMRRILKGHERLASEITYTEAQLEHLYNDVKNGLVPDSLYSKYYNGEQNATREIVKSVAKLKEWETKATNRFNGMVLPIDTIINDLKRRGYR